MSDVYAVVVNGVVVNTIIWDGESDWVALEGEAVFADSSVSIGYLYADGKFTTPPLTAEETDIANKIKIQNNVTTKSSLMDSATQTIGTLQDAVDLEMATDAETAALPLWKKYRVLLSRIDTSTTDDIVWPVMPS
jgi:hypothetical protein